MVSSTAYIPFFFQDKLFILHQSDGDDNNSWGNSYGTVTLRCLWGSAKPFQALFDAVRRGAWSETSQIEITYVRASPKN